MKYLGVYLGILGSVALASCASERASGDAGVSGTAEGATEETTLSSGGDAETSAGTSETAAETSETDSSEETDTGTPNASDCDVWLQDCLDGEKCISPPGLPFDPRCVTGDANASTGDSCEWASDLKSDRCSPTDICWTDAVCEPLCLGEAADPLCPANMFCGPSNSPGICVAACDPRGPSCPEGEYCRVGVTPSPEAEFRVWGFSCVDESRAGPSNDGEACPLYGSGSAAACGEGLACVPAGSYGVDCSSEGCCTRACSLAAQDSTCGPARTCTRLFATNHGSGLGDVGLCLAG